MGIGIYLPVGPLNLSASDFTPKEMVQEHDLKRRYVHDEESQYISRALPHPR
jgi:hypothetical protein